MAMKVGHPPSMVLGGRTSPGDEAFGRADLRYDCLPGEEDVRHGQQTILAPQICHSTGGGLTTISITPAAGCSDSEDDDLAENSFQGSSAQGSSSCHCIFVVRHQHQATKHLQLQKVIKKLQNIGREVPRSPDVGPFCS